MSQFFEQYDSALLGILQNEGNVGGFLDAILGFLYRRTDFYKILTSPDGKMGFPPGAALKILVSAYKKYEDFAKKEEDIRNKKQRRQLSDGTIPPPAIETVEVTTEPSHHTSQTQVNDSNTDRTSKAGVTENSSVTGTVTASDSSVTKTVTAGDNVETSVQSERGGSKVDDDDNPELTRLQQQYQANPESYNGAIRDNYAWSQSITDVDVYAQVPKYITKGKEVKVTIERKHLTVSHKTDTGGWKEVINEDLTWDINKEESMWSLVPSQHVHINLEKKQERWWEGLLISEPKISVRKIDASRPMSDLDNESQAKIEEMMYNDHQKKLGLPTSEEKKMHNLLKDAWDAEGSPFKGQPFDPSKLSMNNGVLTVNPDQMPKEGS
ncbi:hypothetical protein FSP39_008118 [Pinctada imbricata]|uniref:CS domain-containing protein n=1 Tax=Pinctada imbricata TaxID=66713 RepID=A0AA88XX28_PINIB|nr:hypothetical protein FSP39_008118 [Pinctada imbricata]